MRDFIYPFDIVSSNYVDLTGELKENSDSSTQKGLFMVLSVDKGNVTAVKLTSQVSKFTYDCDYVYELRLETHPFLISRSFIQLNKLHTLDVRFCRKLGSVATSCRLNIVTKFTRYFGYLRMELEKYTPKYVSPNYHGGR